MVVLAVFLVIPPPSSILYLAVPLYTALYYPILYIHMHAILLTHPQSLHLTSHISFPQLFCASYLVLFVLYLLCYTYILRCVVLCCVLYYSTTAHTTLDLLYSYMLYRLCPILLSHRFNLPSKACLVSRAFPLKR